MARYNTSLATSTITGTTTVGSPIQGAFIALTSTGGYTVTLPSPALFPGSNQTFYNATSPSGNVTLSTPSGIFSGTGGSGATTVICYPGNVLSVTSDGTNYVVISEDGSALVATTGTFSGDVTMNGSIATVSLTPNIVTIAPVSTGSISNMNIAATGTRGSGAFTSLAANSAVTFTANTASTTTTNGTLVVTGGMGVSGQVTATSVSATNLTGTLQTASQTNITAIGPSSAVFIDGSGNVGINNTNPTKSARFVVNTQGRLDGGTTKIATGAIVSGASSDAPSNLFSASTAIFRVHASDQTNNLQFGIGLGGYGYAPWIQGSYDNNSTAGGPSAGATNLILQPLGGNVGIGLPAPSAKLHVFNRTDGNGAPGTPEIRIEHQDINAIGTQGSNGGVLSFYNIQRDNTGWSEGKVWGQIDFYPSQPTAGVGQLGARILAAADGAGAGAIGGTNTASYISLLTTSGTTTTERLRIGSTGAITATGNYRSAPTSQSGALYLGSDSSEAGIYRDNTYDVVVLQNNSSGNGLYMAGAGNVYIGIDSNNNQSDSKFIVGNNSVKPTNELFSVNESGFARAPYFVSAQYRSDSGGIYQIGGSKGAAANAFDMFQIDGLGGSNGFFSIEIYFSHSGGGMHGAWTRYKVSINAYSDQQSIENATASWGGTGAYSFTRNTNDRMTVRWLGTTGFSSSFSMYALIVTNRGLSFTNLGMDGFTTT